MVRNHLESIVVGSIGLAELSLVSVPLHRYDAAPRAPGLRAVEVIMRGEFSRSCRIYEMNALP